MTGEVHITRSAAAGLSLLGAGDVFVWELPERMSWIVLLARAAEDDQKIFPQGKWATIQSIESQLDECVKATLALKEQRA